MAKEDRTTSELVTGLVHMNDSLLRIADTLERLLKLSEMSL